MKASNLKTWSTSIGLKESEPSFIKSDRTSFKTVLNGFLRPNILTGFLDDIARKDVVVCGYFDTGKRQDRSFN
ncbi:MAG: hypothetical protein Q6356_009640 [Candidatus Wukongarchaeota archaeon]|nr:hypothetical protein [Candidatus Wukongarchaeota archaeon]